LALLVQVEGEKYSEIDKHIHFTYLLQRTSAQQLEKSVTVCIHKNGSTTDYHNYREV
jgi:hypothetical protein